MFDNPESGSVWTSAHPRETLDESLSAPGRPIYSIDRGGSWLEVMSNLGRLQADPNSRVSDKNKIDDLWAALFAIKSESEESVRAGMISVLEECRKKSVVYAKGAEDPLVYMERAK